MLNCWAHSTARATPPAEAAVDSARAASDMSHSPLFSALRVLWTNSTPLALHLVIRGAAVDRRVHLLTQQQRNRREVEVDEQRDGCAEAPVDRPVVGKVGQ